MEVESRPDAWSNDVSEMRHGLVDEYQLLIHPLVVGSGRRLFPDGTVQRLELTASGPPPPVR